MDENKEIEFTPHEINWNDAKIARLWDYYGSSKAHRGTYFGETIKKHFVRTLRRKRLLKKPGVIIDFSCGTGAIIEELIRTAPKGSRIYGYDPSPKSVSKANDRNKDKQGFEGAYTIQTIPTNIPRDSVDLLILTEVVEHLDDADLDSVMSECHRILSPDGKLIITTPNDEDLERDKVICPDCGCIFHRWQHRRSWTTNTLTECLSQYGLAATNVSKITWGNETIDIAFRILRKKPTGILAIAAKKTRP